jgi:pyruvate kinase
VLDEAGGHHVKIISKIESWHGVINYDDILAVTGEQYRMAWATLYVVVC